MLHTVLWDRGTAQYMLPSTIDEVIWYVPGFEQYRYKQYEKFKVYDAYIA